MKDQIMKIWISSIFFSVLVGLQCLSAQAGLNEVNQEFMSIHHNDMVIIDQDLDLKKKQIDERERPRDLARTVKDFVRRIRNSLTMLKDRRSDQMRGVAINRIVADNASDIMRRNKVTQQAQQRTQKDRIQAMREQNRGLKQRIRDLSRK